MPFTRNVATGVISNFLWWTLAPVAGVLVNESAVALGQDWYFALGWVIGASALIWVVVRQVSKSRLRVLSAHYGIGQREYWDVTTAVRKFAQGNQIDRTANNDTLVNGHNPFPGKAKHLIVVYSIFGRSSVTRVDEGGRLLITEETA